MIRFLVLALIIFSIPAHAEEWQLVWVAPGTNWFIKEGRGELERKADTLVGTLTGTDRVSKYSATITLNKRTAQGSLSVSPSDAETLQLRGTYDHIESAGDSNCSEMIQLYDGQNYVGLSRVRTCK